MDVDLQTLMEWTPIYKDISLFCAPWCRRDGAGGLSALQGVRVRAERGHAAPLPLLLQVPTGGHPSLRTTRK